MLKNGQACTKHWVNFLQKKLCMTGPGPRPKRYKTFYDNFEGKSIRFKWLLTQMLLKNNITARFKKCLNSNTYSYLDTSSGQSSNLHLSVVHFFNTSVN